MLIIGIAGGTGSGKSTVVKKIMAQLSDSNVVVVPQDAYYKDSSHLPMADRIGINFDHPDSIEWDLLVDHIKRLKSGESVEQPIYSYLTCTRSKETIPVSPSKVIIVEGILILCNEKLRALLDLKVFVDAPADERLIRVINRDIVERGRSVQQVMDRYQITVKPMHEQFIEPSKRFADLMIPQGGSNLVAIDILTKFIEKNL